MNLLPNWCYIRDVKPNSVLPVIAKVFETVLQEQLTVCFISNNLFAPQQYGFRKILSTELAGETNVVKLNYYRRKPLG